MNETGETLERALKNATNTIDFWQQRAEAAEAEVIALRQQLAAVTALVPEAELVKRAVGYAIGAQMATLMGARHDTIAIKQDVETLGQLIAAIRDWREEQGQEEQDG